MFSLSCDVLNQSGYNLLLTITCGFTLSRDTSPFSASLIIVCPVVAFLSIMVDSFLRVSMGLTVNRQMALKLTVNRQKRNIFTVNRQMSEPKLAVKLLRYPSTIETDWLK